MFQGHGGTGPEKFPITDGKVSPKSWKFACDGSVVLALRTAARSSVTRPERVLESALNVASSASNDHQHRPEHPPRDQHTRAVSGLHVHRIDTL